MVRYFMLGLGTMDIDDSDDMDVDDALAQALRARCPVASLNAALPWDTLTEPERAAWRTMGDAALELCGPAESWHGLITAHRDLAKQEATAALAPYARHRDGCPQAPCSCGLARLLGKEPPPRAPA